MPEERKTEGREGGREERGLLSLKSINLYYCGVRVEGDPLSLSLSLSMPPCKCASEKRILQPPFKKSPSPLPFVAFA